MTEEIYKNDLEQSLIDSAEKIDRKLRPTRIKQLKQSYDYFLKAGLSEEKTKSVMALTSHEVRLIKLQK